MSMPEGGGSPESDEAVQRRRRKAALITSAVVVAAVAIALGAGHLAIPSGGGVGTAAVPPLPTTVPGPGPTSGGPAAGGGQGPTTTVEQPFAAAGSADLQVVVAGSATAGGSPLVATATLDNETGALIDAPGPCVGWLHLGLASPGEPYVFSPPSLTCTGTELPLGITAYPVSIPVGLAPGTYTLSAAGLPRAVHLVQPPTVTLTPGPAGG